MCWRRYSVGSYRRAPGGVPSGPQRRQRAADVGACAIASFATGQRVEDGRRPVLACCPVVRGERAVSGLRQESGGQWRGMAEPMGVERCGDQRVLMAREVVVGTVQIGVEQFGAAAEMLHDAPVLCAGPLGILQASVLVALGKPSPLFPLLGRQLGRHSDPVRMGADEQGPGMRMRVAGPSLRGQLLPVRVLPQGGDGRHSLVPVQEQPQVGSGSLTLAVVQDPLELVQPQHGSGTYRAIGEQRQQVLRGCGPQQRSAGGHFTHRLVQGARLSRRGLPGQHQEN